MNLFSTLEFKSSPLRAAQDASTSIEDQTQHHCQLGPIGITVANGRLTVLDRAPSGGKQAVVDLPTRNAPYTTNIARLLFLASIRALPEHTSGTAMLIKEPEGFILDGPERTLVAGNFVMWAKAKEPDLIHWTHWRRDPRKLFPVDGMVSVKDEPAAGTIFRLLRAQLPQSMEGPNWETFWQNLAAKRAQEAEERKQAVERITKPSPVTDGFGLQPREEKEEWS